MGQGGTAPESRAVTPRFDGSVRRQLMSMAWRVARSATSGGGISENETMQGGATRTTAFGPYPGGTVAGTAPFDHPVTVTIRATDGVGNVSQTTIVVTLTSASECFG